MSKNNTITINGKHYDAESGALLSEKLAVERKPHHVAKPDVAPVRQAAKHGRGHAPEHAKTLARRSVHKPSQKTKPQFKANVVAVEGPADQLALVEVKSSLVKVDPAKLKHAEHVPQSKLITRFAPQATSEYTPVFEAPAPIAMPDPAVKTLAAEMPKTTAALLEKAIEHATSHKQPAPKHLPHKAKKKRTAKMALATVAMVALIGVVTTENLNSLRVHMASSKAGFTAALPAYKPAGFRLGDIKSDSGVVALNYVSNSDQDRSFSVTEKPTTWDNQALLDNVVAPSHAAYQSVPTNGNVYYVYGDHNITWVSGGVWYQVQSKDALSGQQLLDLAKSL